MTVLEYIRALNNVPDGEALTPGHLQYFGGGFLDATPNENYYEEPAEMMFPPEFFVGNKSIIINRKMRMRKNDSYVIKTASIETKYDDDISLHCGKRETPVKLLEDTIKALTELSEVDKRVEKSFDQKSRDYSRSISIFTEALEQYKKQENEPDISSPGM